MLLTSQITPDLRRPLHWRSSECLTAHTTQRYRWKIGMGMQTDGSERRLFDLKWPTTWLATNCLSNFDANGRLEIDLYERTSVGSAPGFLMSGTMKANLHRLGKTPVESEKFKWWARNGETLAATCFKSGECRISQNDCLLDKHIRQEMMSSWLTAANWSRKLQPVGVAWWLLVNSPINQIADNRSRELYKSRTSQLVDTGVNSRTGQFADWSIRGQDMSRTSQFADWTSHEHFGQFADKSTRGLDSSRTGQLAENGIKLRILRSTRALHSSRTD